MADSNLDNLTEDYAPGWRPEEGDTLVGRVTDLSRGWSDESESFYPIVTIHDETKDEDVAIHCFHFVLKKKMRELKPKVGERIAVKFTGKRPTKDGKRTVANYVVRVEGRTVDVWGDEDKDTKSEKDARNEETNEVDSTEEDSDDLPF